MTKEGFPEERHLRTRIKRQGQPEKTQSTKCPVQRDSRAEVLKQERDSCSQNLKLMSELQWGRAGTATSQGLASFLEGE